MKFNISSLVILRHEYTLNSKSYWSEAIGCIISERTILTLGSVFSLPDNAVNETVKIKTISTLNTDNKNLPILKNYTITRDNTNRISIIKIPEDISLMDPNICIPIVTNDEHSDIYEIPYLKSGKWYYKKVIKLKEENGVISTRRFNNSNIFGSPVFNDGNVIGIVFSVTEKYTNIIKFSDDNVSWIDENSHDSHVENTEELDEYVITRPYVTPDFSVEYDTEEHGLYTSTEFNLPDKELNVDDVNVDNKSVSGMYGNINDTLNYEEKIVKTSLYDTLYKQKSFLDYLDAPISSSAISTITKYVSKLDKRLELIVKDIKSMKGMLQFLVDFRWSRFNLLDNYVSFTDYASLVTGIVSGLTVPSNFPVLITRNTTHKMENSITSCCPYSVDYKGKSVVSTSKDYVATMHSKYGDIKSKTLNLINYSCNWNNFDWLLVNNGYSLVFKSTNSDTKVFKRDYSIMFITGVRYVDNYMTVYLIADYCEHALIFDSDFNLVEDVVSEVFPSDIVGLLDPKTHVFRDKFQYYINGDDGNIHTFPLVDMFDNYNKIINKYEIVKTTLKDPRPISITEFGPRINTLYDRKHYMMWAQIENISVMMLFPAVGYTFNKNNFYNPRKYLTNADYNEACIPLHKGFVRTEVYPWFWCYNGLTWHNGYLSYNNYYGLYFSYWNMYWPFFY